MRTATVITTPRMRLVHATADDLIRLAAAQEPFELSPGVHVAAGFVEMLRGFSGELEFSLKKMREDTSALAWWTPFWFIQSQAGELIGMGGYVGPPDESGMVEFGYGVAPAYRGQGYATEAAAALVAHAFDSGVTTLRAHTLPQLNASTRVLIKCGFAKVAELVDPKDGPIWRWEKAR